MDVTYNDGEIPPRYRPVVAKQIAAIDQHVAEYPKG